MHYDKLQFWCDRIGSMAFALAGICGVLAIMVFLLTCAIMFFVEHVL